jgi:hypothetical protein
MIGQVAGTRHAQISSHTRRLDVGIHRCRDGRHRDTFLQRKRPRCREQGIVDRAVPAIVANWDRKQLLELASPELQQKVRPDELNSLFTSLSRLGHLVEYVGARMSYNLGSGGTLTASYLARARFENGAAMIRINLIKRDGDWMINYFYVDAAPGERKTGDI